jgi:hypothetical protein
MGKMATTFDDKLPAFQKYLLEKNLAPAKNVPFYARWLAIISATPPYRR